MQLDLTRALALLESRIPGLQAVYLFGSRAAGAARPDSDIDVGVLAAAPLPAPLRDALAADLAAAVLRDVDLVDLRQAPTVLQHEIIRVAQPILALDPTAAALFEVQVMRAYQLLKERRAELEHDIVARGRVHG
ncbi:MAG: nucleotidyltransferase domain-containing protein [Hyphomonadaceae bacterium]|nr:nucleotidyltransferase domain-containing protein [Hyphomonadaceae bacterium]